MEHVRYIERIRDYYIAQGYEKSYEWAHFDEIPFTSLGKPLSECRVTLLSTADVSVVRAAVARCGALARRQRCAVPLAGARRGR